MTTNTGNIGNRGGRYLHLTNSERKARAASPLVKEILQSTGQIRKKERVGRAGDPPSETNDLTENAHVDSRQTSILLVDDHPIVRAGLSSVLNSQPGMHVVSEASDGHEAIEKFESLRPDIVLIDLRMPVMDGLQAASAICGEDPNARVIILTTYQDEEDIYRVLQAGVRGYILKSAPISEIVGCISAVARGTTWVPPAVGSMLARRVAAPELTRREQQVLESMAAGKSNKEIGLALDISEGTVKVHVTHILEKLRVSGRTEAISAAIKRGLVRMEAAA